MRNSLLFTWITTLLIVTADNAIHMRLCGTKLMNTLKRLCAHNYVTPTYAPWYSDAGSLMQSRKVLVERCCLKPCSYSYLHNFCSPFSTTTAPSTYQSDTESQKEPFFWKIKNDGQSVAVGSTGQLLSEFSEMKDLASLNLEDPESLPGYRLSSLVKLIQYLSKLASMRENDQQQQTQESP